MSNVRQAVKAQFITLAAARLAGEFGEINGKTICAGNKAFRKTITAYAEAEFGVSHASACTAYNFALQYCKTNHPELVVGLGRADDKKGGRPKKVVAVVEATEPTAGGEVVSTEQPEQSTEMPTEVVATDAPAYEGDYDSAEAVA